MSIQDLVEEAEHLWTAEQKGQKPDGQTSAVWGCVALLTNPDSTVPRAIIDGWARHCSGYPDIPCLPEEEPLVFRGVLHIPWPTRIKGGSLPLDMILATATAAQISGHPPAYPSVCEIANAWKCADKRHSEYFWRNLENGITTFQDEEITRCWKATYKPPPFL